MKCFTHPDQDAVALCCYCARGLCRPCCLESDVRIACSESCRVQLQQSQEAGERLVEMFQGVPKNLRSQQIRLRRVLIVFCLLIGMFAVWIIALIWIATREMQGR